MVGEAAGFRYGLKTGVGDEIRRAFVAVLELGCQSALVELVDICFHRLRLFF